MFSLFFELFFAPNSSLSFLSSLFLLLYEAAALVNTATATDGSRCATIGTAGRKANKLRFVLVAMRRNEGEEKHIRACVRAFVALSCLEIDLKTGNLK